MPEVGSAWVTVAPSARGFGGKLNHAAGAEIKKSGIGKTFTKNIGGAAKAAMGIAAGAVAAGVGKIVQSGLKVNRAFGVYQAAFQTLTDGADGAGAAMAVAAIEAVKMQSTMGKMDLASATKSLLGSGVAAADLESTLTMLGKAAMDNGQNMARLTKYYGMARNGIELTQQQMESMKANGFAPAMLAAEAMGKSLVDFEAYARAAGMTNSDIFLKALELSTAEGGRFADVFENAGQTLEGAFSRSQNAWQLFSGAMIGGVGSGLYRVLADVHNRGITPMLTGLYEMAKNSEGLQRLWEAVGAVVVPIFENLNTRVTELAASFFGWLDGIDFDGVIGGFEGMGAIIAPLIGFFSQFATKIPYVGSKLTFLKGPVGLIIGAFVTMWRESEVLRDAVFGAFSMIIDVMGHLQPVFQVVTGLFATLAQVAGDVLGVALEAVVGVLGMVATEVLPRLVPLIELVAEAVGVWAEMLGGALMDALAVLMPPIMQLISDVLPVLMDLFEAIVPIVLELATGALATLIDIVLMVVQAAAPLIEVISQLVMMLLPPLLGLVEAVFGAVAPLIPIILDLVKAAIGPLLDILVAIIVPIVEAIAACDGFAQVLQFVAEVVVKMGRILEIVFGLITQIVGGAMDLLSGTIGTVMSVVQGDWSGAWENIRSTGSRIWDRITRRNRDGVGEVAGDVEREMGNAARSAGRSYDAMESATSRAWSGMESTTRVGVAGTFDTVSVGMANTGSIVDSELSRMQVGTRDSWDGMAAATTAGMDGIGDATRTGFGSVVDSVDSDMARVGQAVEAGWAGANENTAKAWDSMVSATNSGARDVANRVSRLPQEITSALGRTDRLLFQQGADLVNGLINGINSRSAALSSAMNAKLRNVQSNASAANSAARAATARPLGVEAFGVAGIDALEAAYGAVDAFAGALPTDTAWGGLSAATGDFGAVWGVDTVAGESSRFVTVAELRDAMGELAHMMELAAAGMVDLRARELLTRTPALHG